MDGAHQRCRLTPPAHARANRSPDDWYVAVRPAPSRPPVGSPRLDLRRSVKQEPTTLPQKAARDGF